MTVMAISFILSSASALEFTFDSPENITELEEFEVFINAETQDLYDVKIFVYDEKYTNIVSEIYFLNQWKNPWYYLQDVFPETTEYLIRVDGFDGETEICARLRKADQNNYDQVCNSINVLKPIIEELENSEDYKNETDSGENEEKEQQKNVTKELKEDEEFVPVIFLEKEKETIFLNSKKRSDFIDDIPGKKNEAFVSKDQILRRWILIGFVGFVVLLIILLTWGKI